jgi:adenylate kinase family enzyme
VRRIAILGTTGSGKTTLARALADKLGLTHIELDVLYHRPNWQVAAIAEFSRDVEGAASRDAWILEGNYTKVREVILARADTVILLDYPLPLVLFRLVRRIFGRSHLWHGNRERPLVHLFTRESLFLWALHTHRRNRDKFEQNRRDPVNGHIRFIRFSRPGEAAAWLAKAL